jgi:SAM-dependent methyltransferase
MGEGTPARLYWTGNAAKARIIDLILSRAGGRAISIFDYGAGAGGDWPDILRDHTNVRLIGYEPSAARQKLAARLAGLNAEVYGGDPLVLRFGADYIVSFSVLEHVVNRAAYLRTAKRLLAPNGTFFLNYDDGHFRKKIDLSQPNSWVAELREQASNLTASVWPRVGQEAWYQARVYRADADRMIAAAGFRVRSVRYENIVSFKHLVKSVPPDKTQEFMRFWIDAETRLNEHFAVETCPALGDTALLWRELPARTIELTH